MIKKGVFLMCALTAVVSAQGSGPTEEQVKRALFDRYATLQGGTDLRQALLHEVAVGVCVPIGADYRCQINNRALNTSIPMVFSYDAAARVWRFVREGL